MLFHMRTRKLTFADEIRTAITESGLSHYRICKETGIDKGAMSRFMSGKVGVTLDALNRIATVLDLHVVTGKKKR